MTGAITGAITAVSFLPLDYRTINAAEETINNEAAPAAVAVVLAAATAVTAPPPATQAAVAAVAATTPPPRTAQRRRRAVLVARTGSWGKPSTTGTRAVGRIKPPSTASRTERRTGLAQRKTRPHFTGFEAVKFEHFHRV